MLRARAALGTAKVVIGSRATTQARPSPLPALIGLSSDAVTSRLSAVNAVGQVGLMGQGAAPQACPKPKSFVFERNARAWGSCQAGGRLRPSVRVHEEVDAVWELVIGGSWRRIGRREIRYPRHLRPKDVEGAKWQVSWLLLPRPSAAAWGIEQMP